MQAKHTPEHLFHTFQEQINGGGRCLVHGNMCLVTERPDIVCGGLVCQPFSNMRRQDGSSRSQSSVEEHPGYEVVQSFMDYLAARQPRGFLVEETTSFGEKRSKDGLTYLDIFIERCEEQNYAVRAFRFNHASWCEMPRDRSAGFVFLKTTFWSSELARKTIFAKCQCPPNR